MNIRSMFQSASQRGMPLNKVIERGGRFDVSATFQSASQRGMPLNEMEAVEARVMVPFQSASQRGMPLNLPSATR